jgi:flagellin-like hook-associated protein FlgL
MIDLRSEFGTRISGLDTLKETYAQSGTDLKAKKSLIQDADITEVVSQLALSQQLYQGTVQASMKMLQTSILNYI